EPEDRAHECGLAGAVRPEHADEFARLNGEADVGEHGAPADTQSRVLEFDGGGHLPLNALSVASSSDSIQSWKCIPAGSVSVTPTMGMFDPLARSRRRVASASLTCEL